MPTYLMPGAIIAVQETATLTSELLAKPITMYANRDQWGHAEGKLYLDDGISVEQDPGYEHYKFVLSASSIKKWILNEEQEPVSLGRKIDKFILTNSADLEDIDFACYVVSDSTEIKSLTTEFDKKTNTTSFSIEGGFDTSTLRDIYFGKEDS
mmetsp:Transcript_5855/g.9426  ORF Transcript_5855/g.9426 Transcript_5855/m.9426 type:complete len:153 (+) Transcript_5855:2489-2947(+)